MPLIVSGSGVATNWRYSSGELSEREVSLQSFSCRFAILTGHACAAVSQTVSRAIFRVAFSSIDVAGATLATGGAGARAVISHHSHRNKLTFMEQQLVGSASAQQRERP
jgi:hypothetical protein